MKSEMLAESERMRGIYNSLNDFYENKAIRPSKYK